MVHVLRGEHILTKMTKSGVLASVHVVGLEMQDRMAAGDCRTLQVTVAILKLILWRTGSQCISERTGVMWQNRDLSDGRCCRTT